MGKTYTLPVQSPETGRYLTIKGLKKRRKARMAREAGKPVCPGILPETGLSYIPSKEAPPVPTPEPKIIKTNSTSGSLWSFFGQYQGDAKK